MSKCASCGADICWVRMESGKSMPMDREPAPGGDWNVDSAGNATYDPSVTEPRHTSHFATCPNASEHRRSHGA